MNPPYDELEEPLRNLDAKVSRILNEQSDQLTLEQRQELIELRMIISDILENQTRHR